MKPTVSIIVPVYNTREYLDACVASLLAQTCADWEAILVDDGSTDGSAQCCDGWAARDARVRVIHQPNAGPSAARNAGIETAAGEYLAFVDSDDLVEPVFLETLLRLAKENSCSIALCGFRRFSAGEALPPLPEKVQEKVMTRHEALSVLNENTSERALRLAIAWCKLYRRELFATLRFRRGTWHEDEYFCHRALGQAERIAETDAPLYLYRQHEKSFMAVQDFYGETKHLPILDALRDRLDYISGVEPSLTNGAMLHLMDQSQMFYNRFAEKHGQEYRDAQRKILCSFRSAYCTYFGQLNAREKLRGGCFALHPQFYNRVRRTKRRS